MLIEMFISIFTGCFVGVATNMIFLIIENRKYKKQVLIDRYNKLYLPFYKYYLTKDIDFSFEKNNVNTMEHIKNLNKIIFDNFYYLSPKLQTDCMYLIKSYNAISKLKAYQLNETALISERKIQDLSIAFYNSVLKEYCYICKELKFEIPIYNDILINNTKNHS